MDVELITLVDEDNPASDGSCDWGCVKWCTLLCATGCLLGGLALALAGFAGITYNTEKASSC